MSPLHTCSKGVVNCKQTLAHNNLVDVDFKSYLIPSISQTRGHHLKFRQLQTRTNSFLYSFLPVTIREWNSLPADVVNSVDVGQFIKKLNNLY